MGDPVDPCTTAALLAPRDRDDLHSWDRAEKSEGRHLDPLAVEQMARRIVGYPYWKDTPLPSYLSLRGHDDLGNVPDPLGEPAGVILRLRIGFLQ